MMHFITLCDVCIVPLFPVCILLCFSCITLDPYKFLTLFLYSYQKKQVTSTPHKQHLQPLQPIVSSFTEESDHLGTLCFPGPAFVCFGQRLVFFNMSYFLFWLRGEPENLEEGARAESYNLLYLQHAFSECCGGRRAAWLSRWLQITSNIVTQIIQCFLF